MGDTFCPPSQEGGMPWKECHVMDERLRFVARLLEGEKMAPLCAAFGISRKTGYKIFERYKDCGIAAFTDRSRRPYRQANRLSAPIEATIVRLKREYPGWGAPKIGRSCASRSRACSSGDQHGPCGARPPRPGEAPPPSPAPGRRHRALARGGAECPLVCRLQGRVHARQSAVLLSAHHYRLREPLPADLRGAVDDAGEIRVYGVRADIPSIRAPGRDSDGQRGALCVAACALRAEQTGGVVAAARHSN